MESIVACATVAVVLEFFCSLSMAYVVMSLPVLLLHNAEFKYDYYINKT